jgi:hypothetical protein
MVSLSKFHKLTVPIEGHAVAVRVARLSYDQAEAHRRGLEALRLKTARQRQELAAAETLAPEELARIQDVHEREDRETDAFVRTAIEAYVTIEPNQIMVDGREVTTGEDLLNYFGSDTSLVMRLIAAIEAGSRLPAQTGKTFGSLSDSTRSSGVSDASGPEAPGPTPEAIAGSAAPADMTGPAAVTGETGAPSSGSTATSS